NLAGICGFKVIETITHRPFVIFTSSCGKDAAKAFEYKALDYIIKPIAFNRIQLALERYDQWMGAKRNDNSHNNAVIRYSRSILVEKGERLISISLNRITYLKAEKDYTWIYTVDGERYLSSNGIGQLEPRLDPDYFIRIHRSYIVNADYIRSLYRDVGKHI